MASKLPHLQREGGRRDPERGRTRPWGHHLTGASLAAPWAPHTPHPPPALTCPRPAIWLGCPPAPPLAGGKAIPMPQESRPQGSA